MEIKNSIGERCIHETELSVNQTLLNEKKTGIVTIPRFVKKICKPNIGDDAYVKRYPKCERCINIFLQLQLSVLFHLKIKNSNIVKDSLTYLKYFHREF